MRSSTLKLHLQWQPCTRCVVSPDLLSLDILKCIIRCVLVLGRQSGDFNLSAFGTYLNFVKDTPLYHACLLASMYLSGFEVLTVSHY